MYATLAFLRLCTRLIRYGLFLVAGWSVCNQAGAYDTNFDDGTGIAEVNAVQVGDAIYWGDLHLLDGQDFEFELGAVGIADGVINTNAFFEPESESLELERVLVGREFWRASLGMTAAESSLGFILHSASPNPYPADRGGEALHSVPSSGADSRRNPDGSASRIRSYISGAVRYGEISPRSRNGMPVTIPYMVHEPKDGMPKAVCILIPGGAFTAHLEGNATNGEITRSGGNFLIRSAHLFAELGCRAVSMDRPSDWEWFVETATTGTSEAQRMDNYRVSSAHGADSQALLDAENPNGLSVFLLGTSRGAISSFSQSQLVDAVGISSPLTSGNGYPIGETNGPANIQLDSLRVPIHLLYHLEDGCGVTQPQNTGALYDKLKALGKDATLQGVEGGFSDTTRANPCGAFGYHGFLGIESGVVGYMSAWMDDVLDGL